MEFENVISKILADADREKEEIIKEAESKAEHIISSTKEKCKKIEENAKKDASNKYKEVHKMEILKMESSMNQQILMEKLSLLDKMVLDIQEKLISIDKAEYKKFMEKMFDSLDINDGEYIIGKKEKNIDEKTIKSSIKSKKAKISESKENPDFDYGIKIIKGKTEYRLSPYHFFLNNANEFKMEIAKKMFSKEAD